MSTTVETTTEIRPFQVEIRDEQLEDLRRRIEATRWPSKELVDDWSQGVRLAMLHELARYWSEEYDFGRIEARLNALPQYSTEIDGLEIHFIHVRSEHEDALPLIVTHGWPGSVLEMLEVIGPLTDPTAHGGNAEDAFHVVPGLKRTDHQGKPLLNLADRWLPRPTRRPRSSCWFTARSPTAPSWNGVIERLRQRACRSRLGPASPSSTART
jgi:hypothetical protein